ncbi:hypothetical protein TNCV_2209091 [Trichonephila clavipes]|nr:hypothetical protein TNCV_2209091 [Trichonephila clavipes]
MCQHIVFRMLNEDQSEDEVKSVSQGELNDIAKNGSQKCLDDLDKPWQKCVVTPRAYFEKEDVFQQFNCGAHSAAALEIPSIAEKIPYDKNKWKTNHVVGVESLPK